MRVKLAWGVALLTACSGGSGQGPGPAQERAREEGSQASEAGDVAGGETNEFSGDISSCPEIASSEPLDLADPEVASWVAMAQGHHEQTLGWRRLVLSDEVVGFEEHTSVSIDVNVLGARYVTYGSGGSTSYELAGCDGLSARQIGLQITLATADGAVVTTFSSWFQPAPTDDRGMVLRHEGLNPDTLGGVELSGTLDLSRAPAPSGTPWVGVSIEFSADSVRGTLSPEVPPETPAWNRPNWTPIEAIFPDDPCGSQGRSIGLDDYFQDLGATPRVRYQSATARREPIPAVWRTSPPGVEARPLDVPPPTEVRLDAGEPTQACAVGTSVTVYAPLTVTTADGRVNLTQPFAFNLYEYSAYINERTPWVPAADFNEQIGLDGVNVASGYGSVYFQNNVNWGYAQVEGSLEVSQWDAFTDQIAAYPVLTWCRGGWCIPETE